MMLQGVVQYPPLGWSFPYSASVSEVQILGTLIGTGLADTGTADATNLFLSTQAFTATEWLPYATTVADNATTAPDSTTTASSITETAITSVHNAYQGITGVSTTQYTIAFSLLQGLRTRACVKVFDVITPANGASCIFDLAGGAIGVAAAASGSGWTGVSAAITGQSNGFYLCSLTFTTGTPTILAAGVLGDSGSGTGTASTSYLGIASSPAFYVWGAAWRTGSSPGSYVAANTNRGLAATTLANGGGTNFWGTQTANAWVGMNAGVSVNWTRY